MSVASASSSPVSMVTGGGCHGSQPPAFVLPPRNVRVALGADARLEGKVHGRPEPQITWYKDGRPVTGDERRVVKQSGRGTFSLAVGGVTAEDLGRYTCHATNPAGSRQVSVEILLEENSRKKYGLPSSIKTGCRSVVPGPDSRASIWGESPPRFVSKPPGRVCVRAGQTVKLSAKTTGRPQPLCSWLRGEAELQSGGRVSVYERSGLHFLEIREVCAGDAGGYSCVVRNSAGSSTATTELSVEGTTEEHSKIESQSNQTPSPGPGFRGPSETVPGLRGPTQDPAETEQPPVTTSRSRPAVQLPPVAPRRTAAPPKKTASPPSASQQTATLENNRAGPRSASAAEVRFEAVPLDLEVTDGAQASFTCQVSSGGAVSGVTWLKDGAPVRTCPGVEQRQDGSRLTLTMDRVRVWDQGTYRCQLTTGGGAMVASATWTLTVNSGREASRSSVVGEAPRFVKGLKDLKVMDGSRVSMTVEIAGQPLPEVLWLHDGQEVMETEDFQLLRDHNLCTLLIQEVFPEDTGTYSCRARNRHGEALSQARLTVEEPPDGVQPWFITKPKAVRASVGQHVLLSCAISGDPFPQCTWSRRDATQAMPITPGGDFELLQKDDVVSLLIRRVQKHHAGEYLVCLRNSVGECSGVASLSVTEKDEDEDEGRGHGTTTAEIHSPAAAGEEERSSTGNTPSSRGPTKKRPASRSKNEDKDEDREEPPSAPRGLLKRSVQTRERGEEQIRQREAQQLDFRSLLGRRSSSNNNSSSSSNASDAMDFKANLKGVKAKLEDKSMNSSSSSSSQQVDFRAVLGKKGSAAAAPTTATTPGKNATDFRSVLANKKKTPDKNGETPAGKVPEKDGKEKVAVNNCVDGAHGEKKPATTTAAAAGGGKGKGPEFKEKLSDVTVLDGQKLRLQCRLNEPSDAAITWTLDGKVIKASKFIKLNKEGGLCSLTIDKALPEDEGQYKCVAESSSGRSECSCVVLVDDPAENSPSDKKSKKATPTSESEARIKKPTPKTPPKQALPPQILQFPEDMKILAGEKVEILCKFSGAAPVTCTWLKFRKPIQEGAPDISIESSDGSSKLTISSGQQEHCGCYTVELRNSYGLRQAALNLTIVDKPDPPAKVPAASDIRRASLTLSWYGPTYDGGSAVQSYNLEVWDSVGQEWTLLVSCNSTSYNVQVCGPSRASVFSLLSSCVK